MDLTLHQGSVALERLGGLSLQDAAGAAVTCLAGRLWITQEGDARDFVLAPGESLRIARGGLTLVSAVESSRLSVTASRRPGALTRALQWFCRPAAPSVCTTACD
ncbi:MAG: DUF2917 domain-containing protein [Burkholderiales bacterium]